MNAVVVVSLCDGIRVVRLKAKSPSSSWPNFCWEVLHLLSSRKENCLKHSEDRLCTACTALNNAGAHPNKNPSLVIGPHSAGASFTRIVTIQLCTLATTYYHPSFTSDVVTSYNMMMCVVTFT